MPFSKTREWYFDIYLLSLKARKESFGQEKVVLWVGELASGVDVDDVSEHRCAL